MASKTDIETIIGLGDDSMTNQFLLEFKDIPGSSVGGQGSRENIALRMDQTIDLPEEAVGTYDIYFKGLKITKPNRQEETDKTFTCDIRLDEKWEVYDALKAWKNRVFNPINGKSRAIVDIRTRLIIKPLKGDQTAAKNIMITGAILRSIKISAFDENGTDPHRLSLGFIYSTSEVIPASV